MADGGCIGGTYSVDAMSLVRHISDMAQHLTQRLGGRYGRLLSVSFWGSFPMGEGGGGGGGRHICERGGGGNAPSRIDTFLLGCGFELFLA